jgi:hypothetical protein
VTTRAREAGYDVVVSNGAQSFAEERDAYDDLLRDTRGLRREQASAREAWLHRLPIERKEDTLFELEILLKGLACFANPRNHPGPPRRTPVVAHDFREHLVVVREALGRVVQLCRALLLERDRAFAFQRYLETMLPDDGARTKLVRDAMTQDTPQGSLFVLRHGMTNLMELTGGVTRLQRVPYRLFYAMLGVAQREVAQSAFFNPLNALEFRPEFDRITNAHLLDVIRAVPGEHSRRLVALTFLSLFRMLRYLTLLDDAAHDTADGSKRTRGIVFLVMSVLRSDARALTVHLRKRAGPLLAEGYERDLFRASADQIGARYESLLAAGHRLLGVKATLEGLSANMRLEMRRAFEHDFPSPDSAISHDELRAAVTRTTSTLRPALQNAVLFLGKSLGAALEERGVFDDAAARRTISERLRRDVWMFAQIVRAFSHKARAVDSREDRWGGVSPVQFTREFLAYFRAMGYPLLRASDYPRVDAFLAAMSRLEESDLLDHNRLATAISEADHFHVFLVDLFASIGRRDELAAVPFDRRAAAEALRLYLGDSPAPRSA